MGMIIKFNNDEINIAHKERILEEVRHMEEKVCMDLINCIKKASLKVSQQDLTEMNTAYKERIKLGMSSKDAALQVIDTRINESVKERATVADIIKQAER